MAEMWRRLKNVGWMRLTLILAGAGVLMRVLWITLLQAGFGLPGSLDFYLHRTKYLNIVAQVKAQPLTSGRKMHERVDGYRVDVERSPSGSYTITITTRDWGHIAAYGYVFSDIPMADHPSNIDSGFYSVDNPGDMPYTNKDDFPFLAGGIAGQDGHWRAVYNPMT